MTFPLYQHDVFGYPTAMALAVLIGFGFGLALERAGFGKASNLAAQFYGSDTRVLKVMFSAIVTAMAGLGLLGGLGVVELGALQIPETWLGPQIAGGLLLGAGFIISGYCPGTAVVGIASGYLDAVLTIVGVCIGALVFGVTWPAVETFYESGAQGVFTLPEVLGMSWPLLAVGVTAIALLAFMGGEAVERWVAARSGGTVPASEPMLRNAVFVGLGALALAGVVVEKGFPQVEAPVVARTAQPVAAMDVARTLLATPDQVWVVDLRPRAECLAEHIPGGMCLPEDGDKPAFIGNLPGTRSLLLIGATATAAVPDEAQRFAGPIHTLEGGFPALKAAVYDAPMAPTEVTVASLSEYELRRALHGAFTGQEQAPAAPIVIKAVKRASKKGGGC